MECILLCKSKKRRKIKRNIEGNSFNYYEVRLKIYTSVQSWIIALVYSTFSMHIFPRYVLSYKSSLVAVQPIMLKTAQNTKGCDHDIIVYLLSVNKLHAMLNTLTWMKFVIIGKK